MPPERLAPRIPAPQQAIRETDSASGIIRAMSPTNAQLKALAMQWKAAAPALRAQRHKDIRRQDNAAAMDSLNSMFREAVKRRSDRRASGFVEMYRVLSRHRSKG